MNLPRLTTLGSFALLLSVSGCSPPAHHFPQDGPLPPRFRNGRLRVGSDAELGVK